MTSNDSDVYTMIGNGVMSLVGLIFISDTKPESEKLKTVKKLWLNFWFWLIVMYFLYVLSSPPIDNYIWISSSGISTSTVVIIFLYLMNKEKNLRFQSVIFGIYLGLTMLFGFLDAAYGEMYLWIRIMGYSLVALPFILLSYSYRTKHMATALVFFAYGIAQLPILLTTQAETGKPINQGLNFALLIATKLTLIGATFRTMGIRDSES
jgi:hypothetical protein